MVIPHLKLSITSHHSTHSVQSIKNVSNHQQKRLWENHNFYCKTKGIKNLCLWRKKKLASTRITGKTIGWWSQDICFGGFCSSINLLFQFYILSTVSKTFFCKNSYCLGKYVKYLVEIVKLCMSFTFSLFYFVIPFISWLDSLFFLFAVQQSNSILSICTAIELLCVIHSTW